MEKEKDAAQKYYEESKTHNNLIKEINPFALWSFGIGIAPIFTFWLFIIPIFGIILGLIAIPVFIIGIVLGIMGMIKISQNPQKYNGFGFALTGVILNVIYILLIIIGIIALIMFI